MSWGRRPPLLGSGPPNQKFMSGDPEIFWLDKIFSIFAGRQRVGTPFVWIIFWYFNRTVFEIMGVKNFGGVALWPFPPLLAIIRGRCIMHLLGPYGLWKTPLKVCRFLLPVSSYSYLNVASLTPSSGKSRRVWRTIFLRSTDIDKYYKTWYTAPRLPELSSELAGFKVVKNSNFAVCSDLELFWLTTLPCKLESGQPYAKCFCIGIKGPPN